MPAPGLCGVRDVRIERPDGRNHTGRGCRGGGGRKHIELAGDPEGREINMARRPVAGAARLGSVRLFVDVTGRYQIHVTAPALCCGPVMPVAASGPAPVEAASAPAAVPASPCTAKSGLQRCRIRDGSRPCRTPPTARTGAQ